jgi:hypothetical protein
METMTVKLPDHTYQQIKELAASRKISLNQLLMYHLAAAHLMSIPYWIVLLKMSKS